VDELNYELNTQGTGDNSSTIQVQGGEVSYYELRTMIVSEIQKLETMFDQLSAEIDTKYVTHEELQKALEALAAPAGDT
jgi:hypothetical protein